MFRRFPTLFRKQNDGIVVLYHGTSAHNYNEVLNNGLKGGYNLKGGNRGRWDIPRLFLTPDKHVAEKYGEVITVKIPQSELNRLSAYYINDGLGDRCCVIDSYRNDPYRILINSVYLYDERVLDQLDDAEICDICGQECAEITYDYIDGKEVKMCCSCAGNTDYCNICLNEGEW